VDGSHNTNVMSGVDADVEVADHNDVVSMVDVAARSQRRKKIL